MGVALTRRSAVAGREEELRLLREGIDGAVEGRACAVLVHGEAGVGKTHLVRAVCDEAAHSGFTVLWGSCVRFGAVEVPYLPLARAVDKWLKSAPEVRRVAVLGSGGSRLPMMSGGAMSDDTAGRLLPAFAGTIDAMTEQGPVVLVVDDVHWADPASRDVLAYLAAGLGDQALVIMTTHRDEELVTGHPLHGWLADVRRLPHVRDLPLSRLTHDETAEQLTMLLGGRPQPRLLDDVLHRSDGNAYLTELLTHGLNVGDERLPKELPRALNEALLAAWHRLDVDSRETTRILAVAGRPSTVAELAAVAAAGAPGTASAILRKVTLALKEAIGAGIVVAHEDSIWFRHPLLAEVLVGTFLPAEAAPVHAAWAERLATRPARGLDELRRQADLALHYEQSNQLPECFVASMHAADLAHDVHALREEARHLNRAVRLWQVARPGSTDVVGHAALWNRAARASMRVGDGPAAHTALRHGVGLLDSSNHPLQLSRFLIDLSDSEWVLGMVEHEWVEPANRAVDLTRAFPDSAEHAIALAMLSDREAWRQLWDQAREHAEQAVRAARRSGSDEAQAWAYMARAQAHTLEERAEPDTVDAMRHARLSGDPETISSAALCRGNHLLQRGRLTEVNDIDREVLEQALATGANDDAVFFAGGLGRRLLFLGELAEARVVLREGLGLGGVANGAAGVRLGAACLAVREARLDVAELHLERAGELIPALENRPGLFPPATLAEHLLARRRPNEALELLARTMEAQAVDSRVIDEMLMIGARAAADLAEQARDRRDEDSRRRAQEGLEGLVALRLSLPRAPFAVIVDDDMVQPAMEALFRAEAGRCEGKPEAVALWAEAAAAAEAATMRWDQHLALWRQAQALLTERARRPVVAEPLRLAYRFAIDVGAVSLQHEVESVARIGGVSLDEPVVPSQRGRQGGPFGTLTAREREVLAHVVAGRTYAEIAAALFISEKTVSVHVSNLLRKSGTGSRKEVAALAQRLGETAGPA